ncbi:hypothetical protein ACLSYV_01615 [Avibacterium avium]
MNVKPIKTEQEIDYFDIMLTLIEKYEAEHYPIDLSDLTKTKG